MNSHIRCLYKALLKCRWYIEECGNDEGAFSFTVVKDMPGEFYSGTRPYKKRQHFYLYPRNPYTGEFEEARQGYEWA
jgi:hypothetical protein